MMNTKLKKAKQDVLVMLLFALFALLLLLKLIPEQIAVSNLAGSSSGSNFNSQSWPYILSYAMLITSVIGLIKSVMKVQKLSKELPPEEKAGIASKDEKLRAAAPFLSYALIFLYAVLFDKLGYIVATVIVPPILLAVLGCKNWKYYAYVYGFGVCVYVLFKFVFKIPLP